MTIPSSGGSSYPQQGGAPQQQPQGPGSGGFQQPYQQPYQQSAAQQPYQQQGRSPMATLNISMFLALAVTLLGLVNYFISFAGGATMGTRATELLLAGGLLAALRVLPKGPRVMPFAALTSVLGGLMAILVVVRIPVDVPGNMTVLLILGILQMLVAVAALLLDYDVVTLPTPTQQQSAYSQPFAAQPGAYGQQGTFGQSAGQGQGHQPTQYGPPVTPVNQPAQGQTAQGQTSASAGGGQPSQQPTQYASQQGQFFTQSSQDSGETGGYGSQ